jgi:hypothetical protein
MKSLSANRLSWSHRLLVAVVHLFDRIKLALAGA